MVRGIPTLLLFKDGDLKETVVGLANKDDLSADRQAPRDVSLQRPAPMARLGSRCRRERHVIIIGSGPAGLTAGVVRGARQPQAVGHRGHRGRRAAHADDDGRELARLSATASWAPTSWRRCAPRPSALARRSSQATSPPSIYRSGRSTVSFGQDPSLRADVDCRHRRIGQVARPRRRQASCLAAACRPARRATVSSSRAARGRDRRRRHRDGGSDLPLEARHPGHGDPSPRHAARIEGDAGQGDVDAEHLVHLEHRGDRHQGRRQGRGHVARAAEHQHRRSAASWLSTASSSRIGHTPNTALFKGQLGHARQWLHRRRTTARARACRGLCGR